MAAQVRGHYGRRIAAPAKAERDFTLRVRAAITGGERYVQNLLLLGKSTELYSGKIG